MSLIISFMFSAEAANNKQAVRNHRQKLSLEPAEGKCQKSPKWEEILGFYMKSTRFSSAWCRVYGGL